MKKEKKKGTDIRSLSLMFVSLLPLVKSRQNKQTNSAKPFSSSLNSRKLIIHCKKLFTSPSVELVWPIPLMDKAPTLTQQKSLTSDIKMDNDHLKSLPTLLYGQFLQFISHNFVILINYFYGLFCLYVIGKLKMWLGMDGGTNFRHLWMGHLTYKSYS